MAKKNAPAQPPVKAWFSEDEAAVYTGLSISELRRFRNDGRVRYGVKKGGKKILYNIDDLDKFIRSNFSFYEAVPLDYITLHHGGK